ncbi:MAG: radical SAM protein [Eubacteriales bacterium]|nr:radical SAM protein [Eubacteriales bacterium]
MKIIPVFVPHEGCPHDCIFCNQRTITGNESPMNPFKMRALVETCLAGMHDGISSGNIVIAFYGGSFTGIKHSLQAEYLGIASEYLSKGKISSIRLSTRPDYISEEIVSFLRKMNVGTVEIGAQSMDDEVLRLSGRGHDSAAVVSAARIISQSGIELGIQTMMGLPGSTPEKDTATAAAVAALAPSFVRIYPTLVVEGSKLADEYKAGRYKPYPLEQAVSLAASLLEIYSEAGIKVIRVGLQPTDDFNISHGIIAGPFHPSFRQLAESELFFRRISEAIIKSGLQGSQYIEIKVHPPMLSTAVGQKRSNIFRIKKKFGIQNVIILPDKSMTGRDEFRAEAAGRA